MRGISTLLPRRFLLRHSSSPARIGETHDSPRMSTQSRYFRTLWIKCLEAVMLSPSRPRVPELKVEEGRIGERRESQLLIALYTGLLHHPQRGERQD